MKPVSAILLAAILSLCNPLSGLAKVSGRCANCHTMHNSQGGAAMAVNFDDDSESPPYSSLVNNSCIGCTLCAQHCPVGAIAMTPYRRHQVDVDICTRCDTCRQVCPEDAVFVTSLRK